MKDSTLLKNLMGKVNELVYFKDKESRFIRISQSLAERFGLESPEEAIGKSDYDFFEKDHADGAYEDEQQILNTEKPILNKVQKEFLKNHDRIAWSTVSKFPLYDDDGTLNGTFGISTDITKEKEISEKLKQSHDEFHKLSEQIPGFFYLFENPNPGDPFLSFASNGIKDVFELSPDDVTDNINSILERVHPDDRELFVTSIRQSIEELSLWEHEFRVMLPNKGPRWLRGRAQPEIQPDNSSRGYGYITDITSEKKRFKHIARLQEQLQQVIDSAPNLIFVKNLAGEYLMANKSASNFFGLTPGQMVGKKDIDLGLTQKNAERFLEIDKEVVKNNRPYFLPEDKTRLSDGTQVWHQTTKVPFLNTDSGKPAVLSIVTDITRRKKKEQELNNSLDIIGDQNKRLMNFAHIVSHNLRNHAGNISMLLSLYDMEESAEEKEELLSHLTTASNRLNESIADLNDIIDQQYKTSSNHQELNLKEYISKIKEILTTDILAQNVTIQEDFPDDLSFEYNPAYMESILLNLLSNAIKYKHPDRKPFIQIKANKENGKVFLEVSDNGRGIDLDKYGDKLFGMYNTFHNNEDAKGIGLFITKNQIESMGGSIDVESEPGVGTTFKIILK